MDGERGLWLREDFAEGCRPRWKCYCGCSLNIWRLDTYITYCFLYTSVHGIQLSPINTDKALRVHLYTFEVLQRNRWDVLNLSSEDPKTPTGSNSLEELNIRAR